MASIQVYPLHAAKTASWSVDTEDLAAEIRRTIKSLQRRVLTERTVQDDRVVEDIVTLGLRPDILPALKGRRDRREAIRDLATSYAFHSLMEEGKAFEELDILSQNLVHRAFDVIHRRAQQLERCRGHNPLEVEPDLIYRICRSLARYDPRRPMGALIQYKLKHCENAVSRAMRQVQHFVTRPEVTEAFVDYVLGSALADGHKAKLLQLARGGGLGGLDYEATIRFFAQPATVAFVKSFAATVQTARTFYTEEEYDGMEWQGRRRLPAQRRQGYLEAALAELEGPQGVWLDHIDDHAVEAHAGRHEVITDTESHIRLESRINLLHRESFEAWITSQALEARPDDLLWQAGHWLYLEGLPPQEVIDRGLADAASVEAVQRRMAALRADIEIWSTWVATTIG